MESHQNDAYVAPKQGMPGGILNWQPEKPLLTRLGMGRKRPQPAISAIPDDSKLTATMQCLAAQPRRPVAAFLPRVLQYPGVYVAILCTAAYGYLYGIETPQSGVAEAAYSTPMAEFRLQEPALPEDSNTRTLAIADTVTEADGSEYLTEGLSEYEQRKSTGVDMVNDTPEATTDQSGGAYEPEQIVTAEETTIASPKISRKTEKPGPGSYDLALAVSNRIITRAISRYEDGYAQQAISILQDGLSQDSIHIDYRMSARELLSEFRHLSALYHQARMAYTSGDAGLFRQKTADYLAWEKVRYRDRNTFYSAVLQHLAGQS